MKKLFLLFIIFDLCVHAQDTIRFRNGEVKAVKVTEVGIDNVKYNRFDNSTGPVYTVPKNDVRYIKYSVGQIDSFPIVKTEVKQNVHPPQNPNSPVNLFACDKLIFGKKDKILCNGYPLGEKQFRYVLLSLPEGEKKTSIMKVYNEMKVYQKKQYQFGFGGLIVLLAAPEIGAFASALTSTYGDINFGPYVASIAIGGVAAIVGAMISKEYRQKRIAKRYQIVKMYNDEFNFQK